MENVKAILLKQAEGAENYAKTNRDGASFHRSQVELCEEEAKKHEQIAAECRAAIEKLS